MTSRAGPLPAQHNNPHTYSVLVVWTGATSLYVALRFWGLLDYGLWFDEVFSVEVAQSTWSGLFPLAAADAVHPPLFYILLKLWVTLGGVTLLWLKLLPLLLSFAALVPLYLLCRDLYFGLSDSGIVLWLVTVNPYLIHYSQELRMYSLLLCLTLWSLWCFLRLSRTVDASERNMLLLFVVNLLLVYTHYFGWLVVGVQWLCVLIWRPQQLLRFSLPIAGLILCFAPWIHAELSVLATPRHLRGTLGWIDRPGIADLAWHFGTLHGLIPMRHSTSFGILLFTFPVVLLLRRIGEGQLEEDRQQVLALCLFAFVPVAVAFEASQMLPQSVWGSRHLIVAAVPYFLLVAIALGELRPTWLRRAAIVLISAWAGLASPIVLSGGENRLAWNRLAAAMADREAGAQGKVTVYAFEAWVGVPLGFALDQIGRGRFEIVLVDEPGLLRGQHFWMALRTSASYGKGLPAAALARRGCHVGAGVAVLESAQQLTLLPVDCPDG